MNRDDVIRMAREAGYFLYDLTETHGIKTVETDEDDQWSQLERFAALVAAHVRETEFKPDWNKYQQGKADGAIAEREAICKLGEDSRYSHQYVHSFLNTIRARGQA